MDLILEYKAQLVAGTLMTIQLALVSLAIALVFGLTIAKISGGGTIQAFDHSYRPALDPSVNPEIRRSE